MGCCQNMLKYMVFLFNFIFFVTGCVLIAMGAYVQVNMKDYFNFMSDEYLNSSIIFIIIGVVIMVVAFFGCCGACTENYCMLYTYAILLACILLVEIGLAVTVYVFKGQAKEIVEEGMKEGLKNYDGNTDSEHAGVVNTWNAIQHDFQCCGVKSYMDWKNTTFGAKIQGVPDSCCKANANLESEVGCGKDVFVVTASGINQEGCFTLLEKFILENVAYVAGVGAAIAVFQLMGVIVSCCLAANMRKKDNYV